MHSHRIPNSSIVNSVDDALAWLSTYSGLDMRKVEESKQAALPASNMGRRPYNVSVRA